MAVAPDCKIDSPPLRVAEPAVSRCLPLLQAEAGGEERVDEHGIVLQGELGLRRQSERQAVAVIDPRAHCQEDGCDGSDRGEKLRLRGEPDPLAERSLDEPIGHRCGDEGERCDRDAVPVRQHIGVDAGENQEWPMPKIERIGHLADINRAGRGEQPICRVVIARSAGENHQCCAERGQQRRQPRKRCVAAIRNTAAAMSSNPSVRHRRAVSAAGCRSRPSASHAPISSSQKRDTAR